MSGLPDFEGQVPVGVNTKINGAGQRVVRAMHADEKVVLLVEARVKKVGHTVTDDGLKREHTLKVEDLFELDSDEAGDLLRSYKARAKAAEDERAGRAPLPFSTDDTEHPGLGVEVDASGVSMGAGVTAGLLDPEETYSLVFAGGTKALWPDDWEGAGQSLVRCAGGFMRLPNGDPGETDQVLQALDVDTGEVRSEWTPELEAGRLEGLETELAAVEVAEDLAAVEELEAARRPLVDGRLPDVLKVGEVVAAIEASSDPVWLRRLYRHERAMKKRAGVLNAIYDRLAVVEGRSAEDVETELVTDVEGGA